MESGDGSGCVLRVTAGFEADLYSIRTDLVAYAR